MPSQVQFLCPICSCKMGRKFQAHGYWILACDTCGHERAEIGETSDHIKQVYNNEYFTGGRAGYTDYLTESSLLRPHGQRYARLLAQYMEPGMTLDVGAAAGFILQGFIDEGWQGQGIEPNPSMSGYAREELGLDVRTGSLEDFESNERYNLVTFIQVLLHLVEPAEALARAADLTEQGGYWLFENWNRDSWVCRLLGPRWHGYNPPSVLHWFSPEGLRTLAGQFGFREIAHGRPSKWLDGAHAKSILQHKGEGTPLKAVVETLGALVPDRMPIPYPSVDLFWVLFKKQ